MKIFMFFISLLLPVAAAQSQITPYKYTDEQARGTLPAYEIPAACRFTVKREESGAPDIIYYFSTPLRDAVANDSYPIAILCQGSSSADHIVSIIHFHRYFLQEFFDLGCGVLTVEQRGVDGAVVQADEFMAHYTRSNRLQDHKAVIESLRKNPPLGWNGKLIFLGVSEGGPLVTTLTCDYGDITLATVNWSGAGGFAWEDELWNFVQALKQQVPWHIKLRGALPSRMRYALNETTDFYWPRSKAAHDQTMAEVVRDPSVRRFLAGMTYMYHADACVTYPKIKYGEIVSPYLVVAGERDSIIESSDAFVRKAEDAGAPVTYMRVPGMDHYVRQRPDVIVASFTWLGGVLHGV